MKILWKWKGTQNAAVIFITELWERDYSKPKMVGVFTVWRYLKLHSMTQVKKETEDNYLNSIFFSCTLDLWDCIAQTMTNEMCILLCILLSKWPANLNSCVYLAGSGSNSIVCIVFSPMYMSMKYLGCFFFFKLRFLLNAQRRVEVDLRGLRMSTALKLDCWKIALDSQLAIKQLDVHKTASEIW